MKENHRPCVSKERCVEILTEEIQDLLPTEKWEDYERSVNRVLYEFDKLDGAKPKYNKGKHIKSWYTCRNCGSTVEIGHNFCPNCGYKLLWDGVRCLTDTDKEVWRANMKELEKVGQFVVQGFLEGIESVERERIANNALKMSGLPMRRKKSRRDKRGEIRRSFIKMERLLKI